MKSLLEPATTSPRATWMALRFVIVINDIDQLQQVLASKDCTDRPFYVSLFPFPKGILFETGSAWKRHRKIVQPAFNNSVLKTFLSTFNATAKLQMKKLNELSTHQEVDICDKMMPMILENILRTTGLVHNVDQDKMSEYLYHFKK